MPAGQARKRNASDDPAARHRAAAAESRAARDRTRAARAEQRTAREQRRDRGHGDEPVRPPLPHPALADGYGDPPTTEDMPRPSDVLLAPASTDAITETLAALEHTRWSEWQGYLHGRGTRHVDGSITLSAEDVAHWERQMATPYADLSEREKDSDREQVARYWGPLERWIRDTLGGP